VIDVAEPRCDVVAGARLEGVDAAAREIEDLDGAAEGLGGPRVAVVVVGSATAYFGPENRIVRLAS